MSPDAAPMLCGPEYTARAVELAKLCKGISESGGRNRGPRPDEWQRAVGLVLDVDPRVPGFPWCTAGLYAACFKKAAQEMGIVCPFPKTAKAVRVAQLADRATWVSNAAPGVVYILAHGVAWKNERYTDDGHCGIFTRATDVVGDKSEISFNTNAKGSREGDTVEEHDGEPEVTHGGVLLRLLDFSLAPTRRLVA